MPRTSLLLPTLLALGLAFGTGAAGAVAPADGHQAAEPAYGGGAAVAALRLDDGRKWQTDAPLRAGMEDIRQAMRGAMADIHTQGFDAARYGALADAIERRVAAVARDCRLPPAADQQLHLVIADLLAGAAQMRAGDARLAGTIMVVQALNAYGDHFEHAGW